MAVFARFRRMFERVYHRHSPTLKILSELSARLAAAGPLTAPAPLSEFTFFGMHMR